MIWFWSDTHFGHAGIIKHCNRPYQDVEHMNDSLVTAWNYRVRPNDTIYLLGDFAFGRGVREIFDRLYGRKHLVIGNHDERNPEVGRCPWESQSDLLTIRDNGRRIIACHYPLETWKGAQKGYLHIHGHSHGSLKRKIAHRFDVGVEVFRGPVSFDEIWQMGEMETFKAQDHHGD